MLPCDGLASYFGCLPTTVPETRTRTRNDLVNSSPPWLAANFSPPTTTTSEKDGGRGETKPIHLFYVALKQPLIKVITASYPQHIITSGLQSVTSSSVCFRCQRAKIPSRAPEAIWAFKKRKTTTFLSLHAFSARDLYIRRFDNRAIRCKAGCMEFIPTELLHSSFHTLQCSGLQCVSVCVWLVSFWYQK